MRYRLAAVCPACRRQPTERYPEATVEMARQMPLDEEYRDIQCKCGLIYRIAWVALAYAEALEDEVRTESPWAA
jgi:hypothetical protein